MISPLARRRRLGFELRRLRESQDLKPEALSKLSGMPRLKISRLETAAVKQPNIREITTLLKALNVPGGSAQWHDIVAIATDAGARGWWSQFGPAMGERQVVCADLEAGAASVRQFQIFAIPGLLQTAEYIRHRPSTGLGEDRLTEPDRAIEARLMRQEMMRRPEGPSYEVVVDEAAIRRLSAPPEIMRAQLRHLVEVVRDHPSIDVRVLSITAVIADYWTPRSPFTLYTYPDTGDPVVASVDTETTDLIFTGKDEVAPYEQLYGRLCAAALTDRETEDLIVKTIKSI